MIAESYSSHNQSLMLFCGHVSGEKQVDLNSVFRIQGSPLAVNISICCLHITNWKKTVSGLDCTWRLKTRV